MATRLIEAVDTYSREGIAANSLSITSGDFVTNQGGFVTGATASTPIVGLSNQNKTFSSTNQTVAKETLSYIVVEPRCCQVIRATIAGGTVTAASVGNFFTLTNASTVNGASSVATPVVTSQLRLVKFISATEGEFVVV
jgi:hypothetical protein